MPIIPKRQTAYKFWISDLINAPLIQASSESEFDHFLIHTKQVTRVNIIATITQKYENEGKTYLALTLDDSSGIIRIKAWREDIKIISDFNIGYTVMIVGRLRSYNNENYITPEFMRTINNPNWQILRKLELTKEFGAPKVIAQRPIQDSQKIVEESLETTPLENNRQIIFNLIEKYNEEEGADLSKIIEESKLSESEADSIIQELLKEGEIFQPSYGKVKIIE